MKNIAILFATALAIALGLFFGTMETAFAMNWNWNYSGAGVAASGTFITDDTPNELGFYLITEITGTRNGETITGLHPAGTPMPGNEPFSVDNLISLNNQQLTGDGFGYSTASGGHSSAFFADFLPTPGYLEFFSTPPIGTDFTDIGSENSEVPISFSANIINLE